MRAPSRQMTGPEPRALLARGTLAGEWVLDPRRSSVRLKTRTAGLVRVNGVFGEVHGHGSVPADSEVSGTLTVAAASIGTRNTKRDTHPHSADIFDSRNHPHITFHAEGIRPSGQGASVTSAPTVRGRSRPLSFDAIASVPRRRDLARLRGLHQPGRLRPHPEV